MTHSSKTPKATVLVVDDESVIRRMLKAALKLHGYDSRLADNGATALECLESGEQIDVVVSDILMPGVNGVELLRKVRETKPELPLILMTGYSGIDQYLRVMNMGAFEYLPKPLDIRDLIRAIERATETKVPT